MTDVESKKTDSEAKQASVFTAARRAIEQQEMLLNASIAAPGAAAAAGATAGQKWKLESSFAPKQLMSSEMTMEELNVWLRSWESYREISRMQFAPFGVQRAAFLQCLAVELHTKLNFSHAAQP